MVGQGLVASLARPGGNTTGISILATELDGKRKEILMEMVPADNEMAVRFRGSSRPHARNCRCGRPTDRPTLLPHRAYGSVTAPLPLPAYRGDRLAFALHGAGLSARGMERHS